MELLGHRTHHVAQALPLLLCPRMCYNGGMGKGRGSHPNSIAHRFQRQLDYEQVEELWRGMHNQRRVAQHLGVTQGTISAILRRRGIHVGLGSYNKHSLPMDEIASRYLAGETCREIAADYNVPDERIRRRLHSEGVARRRRGQPPGQRNRFWKGGHQPTMHYHRRQSYEVAAICLGHPTPQGMIIHHLDEDPKNNNPENLVLFENQGDHARFHLRLHSLQRIGQLADTTQLATESGGLALPPPPAPISLPLGTDRRAPSKKPA